MLLLSMIRYQVLLCFRHIPYGRYCYKQVKLPVFYYVLSNKSAAEYQGLFKGGVYFFKTSVH